jgi:hypothetical protein
MVAVNFMAKHVVIFKLDQVGSSIYLVVDLVVTLNNGNPGGAYTCLCCMQE